MWGDVMIENGRSKRVSLEVSGTQSASPDHAGGRYGEVRVGEVGVVGGSKNTERDLEEA